MKKNHIEELAYGFTKIRNKKQGMEVLKDLLTPQEIAAVAERIQIVKLLKKNIPHRKISKNLKVSISKVTRGSKAFKKSKGGFKLFLK